MATLLSGVSANGAGSGASHTGPCTVHVPSNSVFDGAEVHIQIADSDTSAEYAAAGPKAVLYQPGAVDISGRGTYFLRALVARAGSSTSLTCTTTQ